MFGQFNTDFSGNGFFGSPVVYTDPDLVNPLVIDEITSCIEGDCYFTIIYPI